MGRSARNGARGRRRWRGVSPRIRPGVWRDGGRVDAQCPLFSCPFLAKMNPAGSDRVYSTFVPPATRRIAGRFPRQCLPRVAHIHSRRWPGSRRRRTRAASRSGGAQLFVTTERLPWRRRGRHPKSQPWLLAAPLDRAVPASRNRARSPSSRSADLGGRSGTESTASSPDIVGRPSNSERPVRLPSSLLRRSNDGGTTWATVPLPIFAAFAASVPRTRRRYISAIPGTVQVRERRRQLVAGRRRAACVKDDQGHHGRTGEPPICSSRRWPRAVSLDRSTHSRSIDGGATWTKVARDGHVDHRSVTFDPSDPMRGMPRV